MKTTTISSLALALMLWPACSDSPDSQHGDSTESSASHSTDSGDSETSVSSSSTESTFSGSSSDSQQSDSTGDGDSTATHDPRCDLEYYDNEGSLCPWDQENLHWGFYRRPPGAVAADTCWPTHYGAICDDPTFGHPFNSIEECLAACPEARNVVEDNFRLQKCDGLAPMPTPYHFESVKVDTATGKLAVESVVVIGCPLYGPHYQLCSDASKNGRDADGNPLVYLRIEIDQTQDNCDVDPSIVKQEYDISSLLAEVEQRPFSIVLDGITEDYTFMVK